MFPPYTLVLFLLPVTVSASGPHRSPCDPEENAALQGEVLLKRCLENAAKQKSKADESCVEEKEAHFQAVRIFEACKVDAKNIR